MPAARRAPVVPLPIVQPKLLLGEGIDELRFFSALLLNLGIGDLQVQQYGGKDNLGPYLKLLSASSNHRLSERRFDWPDKRCRCRFRDRFSEYLHGFAKRGTERLGFLQCRV